MKKLFKILAYVALVLVLAIGAHLYYLTTLAAKETYPEDTYLAHVENKNALIIVAHDDDMIGSSGTIATLCKNGWDIREMCFYQNGGLYAKKDSMKNPIRKKDLQRVADIQGLSGVDPVDFTFRNNTRSEESYMPMPYDKFAENFKIDSLTKIIAAYIEKNKPTVIFTLDSEMGGYGHPDHVLVSKIVLEYCQAHKSDSGFSVKKIYQAVFTPTLSERVMRNMPVYAAAKKVYQRDGMPFPDVQFNITANAALKKECMQAYTTEQNSLRQIWPYYHWYPASVYFGIFDRDFFRVIEI
ncbi:MAG: hypothetical protein HOP08_04730 [Cyclobacteriaceae bacterium]|nr:hypothetical protein [Cyclobacteriaceae bacterium]